jgi:hypothetical protein
MRSKHHPLALLLALLAALAVFAGACTDDGGDEASDDPTNTVEEEGGDQAAEQLDELCTTGRDDTQVAADELSAALTTLGFAAPGEPQYEETLDEAEAAAQDLIDALDAFITDAQALDVPEDQQAALDDYIAVKQEQVELAERLKEGLANDSADEINAVNADLEAAEEDHDQRSSEAADILQAQECQPDSSGDDSGNSGDGTDDSTPDASE